MNDWLDSGDINPPATDRMAAVRQHRTPAKATGASVPQTARHELGNLRRSLPKPQLDYLECLQEGGFNTSNARALMVSRGYLYDRSAYTRWRQKPKLQRAIQLSQEIALETANISAAKVLLNVNTISEHGLQQVVLRDRKGEEVLDDFGNKVYMMRDPSIALKANELLGKNKRLWRDDQDGSRVTVQLINLTGDETIASLEAEPIEIEQ